MSTTKLNQAIIGEALYTLNSEMGRGYALRLANIGQLLLLGLIQPTSEYQTDNIGVLLDYLEYIDNPDESRDPDNSRLINFEASPFNSPTFNEPDTVDYRPSGLRLTDQATAIVCKTLLDMNQPLAKNKFVNASCGYLSARLFDIYGNQEFQKITSYCQAKIDYHPPVKNKKVATKSHQKTNDKLSTEQIFNKLMDFVSKHYDGSVNDPLMGVVYESH